MKEMIKALVKAQSEIKQIVKDSTSKALGSYQYLSLDKILDIVKPILNDNGLFISQDVTTDGIQTTIYHISGESLKSGFLLIDANSVKNNAVNIAQATGIVTTYAKRYQLSALLGISTEDDTDSDLEGNTSYNDNKPWFNDAELETLKKGIAANKPIESLKAWLDTFKINKDKRSIIKGLNKDLI